MMRKVLEFGKHSKRYAVCPSCNKLYNESEIRSTSGFKCNHVEFPNHPRRNLRKPCGTEVTDRVPTTSGFIIKPKMVYPLPSLKAQIIAMYRRPGFESLLEKWANRDGEAGYIPIFMMEKYGKLFHLVQIIQQNNVNFSHLILPIRIQGS